jgi:hypothetical protein
MIMPIATNTTKEEKCGGVFEFGSRQRQRRSMLELSPQITSGRIPETESRPQQKSLLVATRIVSQS